MCSRNQVVISENRIRLQPEGSMVEVVVHNIASQESSFEIVSPAREAWVTTNTASGSLKPGGSVDVEVERKAEAGCNCGLQLQDVGASLPEESARKLGQRELDVARLVARALSNQEIASLLGVGIGTVKNHLAHIFTTLRLSNRTELALWWWKNEGGVFSNRTTRRGRREI